MNYEMELNLDFERVGHCHFSTETSTLVVAHVKRVTIARDVLTSNNFTDADNLLTSFLK